jgi:hypothetical protein
VISSIRAELTHPGLVDEAITANYRRPAIEVAAKYSELGSLMITAGAVGLISHDHRSLTSDTAHFGLKCRRASRSDEYILLRRFVRRLASSLKNSARNRFSAGRGPGRPLTPCLCDPMPPRP